MADLQVTEDVPSKRLSEVAGQPVLPSAKDADKDRGAGSGLGLCRPVSGKN
ncbi:hypothetical protein AB2762_03255 [Acinetobacter indicus]